MNVLDCNHIWHQFTNCWGNITQQQLTLAHYSEIAINSYPYTSVSRSFKNNEIKTTRSLFSELSFSYHVITAKSFLSLTVIVGSLNRIYLSMCGAESVVLYCIKCQCVSAPDIWISAVTTQSLVTESAQQEEEVESFSAHHLVSSSQEQVGLVCVWMHGPILPCVPP